MAVPTQSENSTQRAPSTEHLSVALGWLHRLLHWQVEVTRHTYGKLADDAYRGLYIPDSEIEQLQQLYPPLPDELEQRRRALYAEWRAIEEEALAVQRAGATLPLIEVAQIFGLGPIERATLLLALAPEIDLRFERLYAYIQDDVTRKRPSVDLALRLFAGDPRDRLAARAAFLPEAPLLANRMIQLLDDPQRAGLPLLARSIRLDDRIATALLGQIAADAHVAPALRLSVPDRPLDQLVLPAELVGKLRRIMAEHPAGLALALQGSYGSGRRSIAEGLCADLRRPLIEVDLERLSDQEREPEIDSHELLRRVVREARLTGAALLWRGGERMLAEDGPHAWRHALLGALDTPGLCSFLVIERPWEARGHLRQVAYMRVELPGLAYSERERIWAERLGADSPDTGAIQALASTFRLTGGQIRDAAGMARTLARWRGARLAPDDLYAASRAQSSGRLDSLAHKIRATYSWGDIVLPADQVAQLREICIQVRHRRTVLERWGFDRHLAMGKGVNVLFAGQSGTGKTMAAEIIAADLGLELFKVDLATMVSKYIGETEKNLDKVFSAAREANAILFFDEADAIFGKRSEVKDAHDRYANIEVGYLLQKMESYDGVVILATNLKKNLDEAFVRRLHTTIDFPFPEEPDRLRIWRKVFPASAPLAADVDLTFLSRQFKLAGGNIRNIALLSAYLAAEDGPVITMAHLIRATRREYQKLGKLLTEADFGPYLSIARESARVA